MGGGKSRALCEEVFDHMLDNPGIAIAVIRQKHTAIVETTRKTFIEQVLPQELRDRKDLVRIKQSQGEDLCEFLWNGSKVMFVGLDDPGKFFSAEFGMACFDEAHEIMERDVLTVNTRLRQRCKACEAKAAAWKGDPADLDDCDHYPHSIILTFNPSHPGHWLRNWFILGTVPTEWGHRKDALVPKDADRPIGDAEFFISRATDNPHLPKRYVDQTLGGLSSKDRRRYLEGYWEYTDESGFFDSDALARLTEEATPPILVSEPAGDLTGLDQDDKPRLLERKLGRLHVWKAPVRLHIDKQGDEVKAHRYVVAVDASSGTSQDYSAFQIISVEDYEQVGEWQGMVDPDLLAEASFRAACVFNGALIAPEITGGYGFAVTKRVQHMIGQYKGPQHAKPRLYTRPIIDRISQQWTDRLGWDTNVKSRAHMLDVLEQSLRDGSLKVNGVRTLAELAAFTSAQNQTTGEYRNPRAAQGEHDDLVISLAIGATIASKLPKHLRTPVYQPYVAENPATGW